MKNQHNHLFTKSAFTLAEVLIVISIIGVVAAMTIPTLLNNQYEKKTVSLLRETQSILSQAFRMAEQEYGDPSGWGFDKTTEEHDALIAAEKLKPFLKIATDCGVDDSTGKCFANENYKTLNNGDDNNYATMKRYYKFTLMNGTAVAFRGPYGSEENTIRLVVDINGKAKPNTSGRDTFAFLYEDGSLFPIGGPDCDKHLWYTCSYIDTCSNITQDGNGCAYYVLHNGNMNYLHKKN